MLRRTAALVTSGALALGGVALLVPHPATAQQGAAAQAADKTSARPRLLTQEQRQQLRSTGHLQLTKDTKRFGTITVLVQRGEVTALSATSISLKSKDGFAHSYTITARTKVREKGASAQLSDLKVGERAMVVALVTKNGDIARRISCIRPAPGAAS